jgi:glycosyltransferase involved in cell wall biosynthesis
MKERLLRPVLLIAEQANPEWVSVPLVGWSLATAIARQTPALIATHVRNREAFLRAGLVEQTDFVAIDNESVAAPLHRFSQLLRGGEGKGWTAVTALESLSYYAFESQLWRLLGERIRGGEFALVHRITPLSPTAPSLLAARCHKAGVPFVIGPLNGGLPWPPGFAGRRIAEREWLSYVRSFYKLLPGYRSTRELAASIIVASRATKDQLGAAYQSKTIFLPENGVPDEAIVAPAYRPRTLPLKVLFVGRLVPYKCPDLLVKAAAPLLRDGRVELTIVGGGPLDESLRREVDDLRLSDRVHFRGWLERTQVMAEMSCSDVLALPSIREFGGGVVLEAMARGLPSLVANYGGPAELVDRDTGILVDFDDEISLVANIRASLETLAANPSVLASLSANCLDKVKREHTWTAKAETIVRHYATLSA